VLTIFRVSGLPNVTETKDQTESKRLYRNVNQLSRGLTTAWLTQISVDRTIGYVTANGVQSERLTRFARDILGDRLFKGSSE
jgi:hypothetical protein